MIKINLLPPRKKKALVAGQRHMLVILAALGLECLALAWIYSERNTLLEQQESINTAKRKEVTRLKEEIGDLEKLKAERTELQKQQEILDSLESARSGPVRVLNELAFLLSPTISEKGQVELLRRNLNTTWDPRRVSLSDFREKDREVHITGFAKTNDDVAEFMKRLGSSIHFKDVQLNFTRSAKKAELLVPVVSFDINCRISYTGRDDESSLLKATSKRG